MYVLEGKAPAIALSMARALKTAMETMNRAERRLWKKVREHEFTAGLLTSEEDLAKAESEAKNAIQERSPEEEVLYPRGAGETTQGDDSGVGSCDQGEEASEESTA